MLHISAKWRFKKTISSSCDHCGKTLIPHLPRCMNCRQDVVQGLMEIPCDPDDFSKPLGAVRIAHLSDLHIGYNVEPRMRPVAVFRMWLDEFVTRDVDILIVSGDLIERPGDQYGLLMAHALLKNFPVSWMVVPGNHDIKRPGHHDVFFDIFGQYPRVETHHGIDFILLDSMRGLPMEERDVAERMYGDYVCYTEGRVGEAQYAQVDAALDLASGRERHVVLHHHVMRQHAALMPHVPRQANLTEDVFGTMKALLDSERLFDWAASRGISTLYHGHKHVFMQPGVRQGRLLILNGGTSTLHEGLQQSRFVDVLRDGDRHVSNLKMFL